ncbi:J domain-containing protein [Paenibacillus pinihumi]|uniref:J domain-containing protein n=1 Tax=Paenibacillus pinihumi TaxID=669462 RepID=UPI000428236F|nr:DnaJ domain-containing protein [Paenibacillus pinihumi]
MQSYYEVLGVARTATAAELKSAYRKLAKQLHPDVNGGTAEAEQRFKKLKEAYETLSDPEKRQAYDLGGNTSGTGRAGSAESQPGSKTAGQAKAADYKFDPAKAAQSFDRFFGFHPDSKKRSSDASGASGTKRNPLDMTDRFNQFFGKR